jgi:hypothetical protein
MDFSQWRLSLIKETAGLSTGCFASGDRGNPFAADVGYLAEALGPTSGIFPA